MIVTIFGETRERVAELYDKIPIPKGGRVQWKLYSSYTGPIGHACFAPDHPDIEEAYRDQKLRALNVKKPKKQKPVSDAE